MINVKKLENNVKSLKKKINTLDTIFSAIIFTIIFLIAVICPLIHTPV